MQVETVTEYVARDGARFRKQEHCQRHEHELDAVEPIMARLPKNNVPYGEYVQHDREFLLSAKRDLWKIVQAAYAESYPEWLKWSGDEVHPYSIVGRVLDDIGGPISSAWSKLMRFNFDLGREYEQCYFALHPDKATVEHNPNRR